MSFIQTYSGKKVYPLELKSSDIDIRDIAHALSNICRFTGHCKQFYSVAQHSVYVSNKCDSKDALWGLLHDASEAYICDLSGQLKENSLLHWYKEIEIDIIRVVCVRYGLPYKMPESVKVVDGRMLATEKRDLMSDGGIEWGLEYQPYDMRIYADSPTVSESNFISRFHELYNGVS